MTNESSTIVQRLWNYCNVLRDDGMSYGDYVEQLTYLLSSRWTTRTCTCWASPAPSQPNSTGPVCAALDGDELESHYRQILTALGQGSGLIPVIFRKAQNKIQDPAKLRAPGRADRRRDLDRAGYRRQRRDLRRPAGKERPGYQDRRRAVLHPAPADQGHRGCDAPRARADHLRPGLRHGRLPACRA